MDMESIGRENQNMKNIWTEFFLIHWFRNFWSISMNIILLPVTIGR
jgi:hypothetical protein